MTVSFTCSVCGAVHESEVRDTRFSLPEPVFHLSPSERAGRAWCEDDWCVLDGASPEARHFVRGLLRLPVRGATNSFGFGVWIEVAEPDFALLVERWFDPGCGELPDTGGRLANELRPYDGTLGLEVALAMIDDTRLPEVTFVAGSHEAVRAQRSGLDRARLAEVVSAWSH